MRPIDAVAGLPKSPDIAKLADTAARQGDMQTQVQSLAFSREIAEKTKIVSESSEVAETTVDTDTQDSQGSATDGSLAGKHKHGRNKREKTSPHPTKGKILDIHGA